MSTRARPTPPPWSAPRLAQLPEEEARELLQERFETRGIAPTRTSAAGHLDAGGGASFAIGNRWSISIELAAQTHFFAVKGDGLVARFAARGIVLLGAWL